MGKDHGRYSLGIGLIFKTQEKAVKLEADSILGEVRQKQTEASRMQQLLESLKTLRQARINKGASHGYMSTPTDDLYFSSTKSKFVCLFVFSSYFIFFILYHVISCHLVAAFTTRDVISRHGFFYGWHSR